MKRPLFTLLFVLIGLLGVSQKYIVKVSLIQNFEHPFMLTNDAITKDSITYLKSGFTGNSTYTFDLTNKKLYRNLNGLEGIFDIVSISNDNGIFYLKIIFPDLNMEAYYTLTEVDNNKKMLTCRWVKGKKIIGWFDKDVIIKKES